MKHLECPEGDWSVTAEDGDADCYRDLVNHEDHCHLRREVDPEQITD